MEKTEGKARGQRGLPKKKGYPGLEFSNKMIRQKEGQILPD